MGGTHQVRSLPTKTSMAWSPLSGHGLLIECFEDTRNEIHAPSPQPAHKKRAHRWVNGCPRQPGKWIYAPSPQPAHKKWGCGTEGNPQPAHKNSGTIEKDSDPIRHNVIAVCNHVESDCGYLIRNGPHCNTCAILEYFRLEGCLGGASNQMHAPIPQGWGTTIGPRLHQ